MTFYTLKVDTDSGGDGTGTFNGLYAKGYIEAIRLDFNASADAGINVTITEPRGVVRTLLDINTSNTDATYHPRIQAQNTSGAGETEYSQRPYIETDNFLVTVDSAGAELTSAVTVIVQLIEV